MHHESDDSGRFGIWNGLAWDGVGWWLGESFYIYVIRIYMCLCVCVCVLI